MTDTVLQLGEFAFADVEIPETIRVGGIQRMSIKTRIGGKRRIDCMGREDRPLEWTGMFTGATAAARARFLDGLRTGGQPQSLTWGYYNYTVVVREFEASYERFYRIPYRIACEVVSDNVQPLTQVVPSVDAAIDDDMTTASGLGDAIGDGPLSSLLGGLDTAIGAVSSFATAAQSTINSVLAPLAAVQSRLGTLIQSSNLTMQNVTTFGGVLPGAPAAIGPGLLAGQTQNMLQANNLFELRNVCGRMGANLVSLGSPPKKIALAGGNLFQVAQQQYGDANAWTAIAKANGMTDPFVVGTATLAIPPRSDQSGGILSA